MKSKLVQVLKSILTKKITLPSFVILIFFLVFPLQLLIAKINPNLIGKILGIPMAVTTPSMDYEKYLPNIKKLISLPDETPVYAAVSDIEKINNQPFFKAAQNGDIVLVFQNSRKTILYRPSENKIIEVGTVQSPPAIQPTPTTGNPLTLPKPSGEEGQPTLKPFAPSPTP